MKILAIRGKNLASLENFDVAFESGPLERTGIFAITGPTGAGKTTLLDAMCVALFDRTPRLSGLAGVPVGSAEQDDAHRVRANDARGLLRRGTGEGFAEVDFLGRDDRSYRARWEVHRARKSARGKLQQAVLSLTDMETGRVNTGKKTETLLAIENCLGLSFEQFRRSALLAQNDFSAFLRADKDERSELLERMTGTEVYTRVSVAAFRRASDEAKSLELLQEAADTSALLDEEARIELEALQVSLKAQDASARLSLQRTQADLRWYSEYDKASLGLAQATTNESEASRALTGLLPAELEMRACREARRHSGVTDAARLHRQEAEQALATRASAQADRASAEADLGTAQIEIAAVASEVKIARQRHIDGLNSELRLLQEVADGLHAYLVANEALRAAGGERAEFLQSSALELDQMALALDQSFAAQEGRVDKLKLEGNACKLQLETARLSYQAARGALEFSGLVELRQELATIADSIRDLEFFLELAARAQKTQRLVQAAQAEQTTLTCQIGELLEGGELRAQTLRSKRDVLKEAEQSFDRIRIALDLSAQRAELKSGESCPLCGSEQHPFSDDALAVQTIVSEQRARVETLRGELTDLNSQEVERDSQLAAARHALQRAELEMRTQGQEVASLRKRLNDHQASDLLGEEDLCSDQVGASLQRQHQQMTQGLIGKRAELASAEEAEARTARLGQAAEEWQVKWDAHRESLDAALETLKLAGERRGACSAQRYRCRANELQACRAKLEVIGTKLVASDHCRFPELEIRQASAMESERAAGQRLAGAEARLESAEARIVETQKAIDACDLELEEVLDSLECSWGEFGRRLSVSEASLGETEHALLLARQRAAETQGSLRECKLRMAELETLGAPAHSAAEAQAEGALLELRVEALREQIMDTGAKLKSDDLARKSRDELDQKLLKAVTRAHTFRTLSDLIGSADGKKFRVFAQSLTLDSLLQGANQHLSDLAPRYLLQRVPGYDLDLQIVDRDLGDDLRSVNSLSGGESFLISLALALGLSSLASREVRVESLMVDEGFGSLDEDTLEIALGVLDSLQATGRKVGLISHVPGFAERIGAQIRVTPQGGGKSSVQVCGPGGL